MTHTKTQHNTKGYSPDLAIHPGEILVETLESLKMSQKELAERADLTPKTINKIVKRQAPITPETAVKLERVLGISASFWNNLDKNYQEIIAKQQAEEKLEQEIILAKKFTCYRELADLGFVKQTTNITEKVKSLLTFFAVDSLSIVPKISSVAFSRSHNKKGVIAKECVAAWLRCAEIQAKEIKAPTFDKDSIITQIPKLKELTLQDPSVYGEQMKQICLQSGIILIFTPYFKNTYINGATRWINDNPVIQLSLRFSYSDMFWFTFFHELGHIILHGKTDEFVEFENQEKTNGLLPSKEVEANQFAANKMINPDEFNAFIKGQLNKQSLLSFAKSQSIHPSIVAGRLAHEGKMAWKDTYSFREKLAFK